jgi:hypothetical protein
VLEGSFMREDDAWPYWRHYEDRHMAVTLAAEPAGNRVFAVNDRLDAFAAGPLAPSASVGASFFPPALGGGVEHARVDARMSGGRTFLIAEEGARRLGLPPHVDLDLGALGWGEGHLRCRLEVKGAGTAFARTKLDPLRLGMVWQDRPDLRAAYDASRTPPDPPPVMASLGLYLKTNLGGQSEGYARHAVGASAALLGRSRVRFAPVWMAVAQSSSVVENMRRMNVALPIGPGTFAGTPAVELRFSPGSVRALYFDNVHEDERLRELAVRVSTDAAERADSLGRFIGATRDYLELLPCTTTWSEEGFHWIKVGDINEKFKPDSRGDHSAAERYRRDRNAWYLAKDQVVVRRLGPFFTDMEGFFGRDRGFLSRTPEDLRFHHELFALTVLRDHGRICTQLAVACELLDSAAPSAGGRRRAQRAVMDRLVHAVNESPDLALEIGERRVRLDVRYARVPGLEQRYDLDRAWLGERY